MLFNVKYEYSLSLCVIFTFTILCFSTRRSWSSSSAPTRSLWWAGKQAVERPRRSPSSSWTTISTEAWARCVVWSALSLVASAPFQYVHLEWDEIRCSFLCNALLECNARSSLYTSELVWFLSGCRACCSWERRKCREWKFLRLPNSSAEVWKCLLCCIKWKWCFSFHPLV